MILVGNLISFIAAIFTVLSSWSKERAKIYMYQTLQCATMAIASIFFFSFSGMTTFILCAVRNYFLSKNSFDQKKCIFFLIVLTIIGCLSNNRGYLGIIPILTTFIYTVGCFLTKKEKAIKVNIIINLLLWAFYEFYIMDYVSVVVDATGAVVAILSLLK